MFHILSLWNFTLYLPTFHAEERQAQESFSTKHTANSPTQSFLVNFCASLRSFKRCACAAENQLVCRSDVKLPHCCNILPSMCAVCVADLP